MIRTSAAVVLAGTALVAVPASAATTITFDSLATGTYGSITQGAYRFTLASCTSGCLSVTPATGATNGNAGGQVLQNALDFGTIQVSRIDGATFSFDSLGISGSGASFDTNIDVNFAFALSDLGFTQAAQATIDVTGNAALYSKVTPANLFSGVIDLTGKQLSSFTIQAAPGASFGGILIDNLVLTSAADSPVPEAPTWAMMIGGFGLVGGALRRRRATVRFA